MAIFGAYMYPLWPDQRALAETIKAVPRFIDHTVTVNDPPVGRP